MSDAETDHSTQTEIGQHSPPWVRQVLDNESTPPEGSEIDLYAVTRPYSDPLWTRWATNVPAGHHCFCTVNGMPRQTDPGQYVWFVEPTLETIYAYGKITDLEDRKLCFEPLKETQLDAPKEPPTRGFTYCEPVLEQSSVD